MLTVAIAIAVIVIVGFWVVGGVLLRAGGIIVATFGVLVLAIDHSLAGIILLAVGVLFWLAGHWHYALRHHEYKSPLAQQAFQQFLPHRLDRLAAGVCRSRRWINRTVSRQDSRGRATAAFQGPGEGAASPT
jgi:hypothetical protein